MSSNAQLEKWFQQKATLIADLSKAENHKKLQHIINQITNLINTSSSVYPQETKDYLITVKSDLELAKSSLVAENKWTIN